MMTSTDPVSPEHAPPAAQLDAGETPSHSGADTTVDLYAESELRRRQERTERMIRRAEEQLA